MTLLLTSGWAEIFFPVTGVLLGLGIYFIFRAWKASKSGSKQQSHPGSPGVKEFAENIPIHKVASFKLGVGCIVVWLAASIWIFSDYSSKPSKKIPQQQTDTTRQATEDMVKPVSWYTPYDSCGYIVLKGGAVLTNLQIEDIR